MLQARAPPPVHGLIDDLWLNFALPCFDARARAKDVGQIRAPLLESRLDHLPPTTGVEGVAEAIDAGLDRSRVEPMGSDDLQLCLSKTASTNAAFHQFADQLRPLLQNEALVLSQFAR